MGGERELLVSMLERAARMEAKAAVVQRRAISRHLAAYAQKLARGNAGARRFLRSERESAWDIRGTEDGISALNIQGCGLMGTNRSRAEITGSGLREIREGRAVRTGPKISQEDLAKRIGVRQKQVSDWERGVHEPSEANQRLLAAELDCHWTDFFRVGLLVDEVAA